MAVTMDGTGSSPVESRASTISDDEIRTVSRGLEIVASRRLSDPEDVRDAVQETLARTVEAVRQGRIPDNASLGAFAYGIHRHVVADVLRERYRDKGSTPLKAGIPAPDPSPLERLVTREQRTTVSRAVSRLSLEDRALLRRCFVDGERLVDIAQDEGVPPARVRKRKSRALKRLREILGGPGGRLSGHDPDLSPTTGA